ncbi:putative F-box/kelch-repeat protein At1g20790 [Solanum dulcamara]|uniref:putative F-box/kelch-repeat protein At1g20790 n=1 Tax=Solanum dulcamara TaxID=45834 RepID=UPI002485411A|nr:putative F-box/kelch-repeat protein At1g20790 [Solanum dulcamara]
MTREQKKYIMEFRDDILWEIISRLPLKFVVQCKLLSKNINSMISHPEFAQNLYQRHKDISTQLIYSINDWRLFRQFHKISLNPITQYVTTLCYDIDILASCNGLNLFDIEILASCNGLILFDFEKIRRYCVFNPTTGEHQLIPYPMSSFAHDLERTGLAVDYPNSDQYKLVTISSLIKNSNLFYKFHILSSERSGLWHEIQLRTNTFTSLPSSSPPVYWRDSLYWLRSDGSVIAFDTNREEAILIDRPEFLDHFDLSYGKISTGEDIWLGRAQGLLTLVCIFRKFVVIATYDSASSRWRVSQTFDNFVLSPEGTIIGFPVWIDSKQVSFLVERLSTQYHDLYEYDTEINKYKNAAVLDTVNYPMFCVHQTLACVHKTPSNNVTTADQTYIAAKLDLIRRFIMEGISIQEESSSGQSSAAADVGGEEK